MTEILTESFCERCGTRYTFETVQQRGRPLSRLGTLGRGLKHFVVMPEASLDEAMAVARSETEQRTTNAQLEAFHRTFNFCLSCRQYTCRECWNPVEGRCLSCAPMPIAETIAPAAAVAETAPVLEVAPAAVDVAPEPPAFEPEPATEVAVVVPEPVQAAEPAPEPATPEPATPEPAAPEPTQPEPAAPGPLAPEPATSPDDSPIVGSLEPAPGAEPGPPPAAEPRSKAAPEPTSGAEPEAPPAPAPTPVEAPSPGFRPGRSLDDEIAAYELRMAALATIPTDPGPDVSRIDVAATRLARAEPRREAALGTATQAAVPTGPASEEAAVPALPPGTCRTCGLSISASARFCRRCGTRQGD